MKVFESNIVLDSNYHKVGNNRSHLLFKLQDPLQIPIDGQFFLKIVSGKIPMTVYNITSSLGNNKIHYSVDDNKTEKEIVFPNGIYSMTSIHQYIKYALVKNGDYQLDPITGEIIYPFSLTPDIAQSKSYLIINTNFTGYADVIISLSSIDETGLFYLLCGYTLASHSLDGDVSQELISTNNINIYDSQYIMECNQVLSYSSSGRKDARILYFGNFKGDLNAYEFLEEEDDIIAKLPNGIVIDNLEIKFLDRNGNLINFSDNSTDSNITLNCMIVYHD